MRKFLVFVAGAVLLFLLYMTVTASITVLTFTPGHIKKWLKDGDVYSGIIDSLTKQGQTAVAQTNGDASQDNSEQVKAAIKKAVTPQFLQQSTEQLIDGTTPWLEGKTAKPSFNIDVSGVKQSFIQELANQARARYASLPPCAPGQIPDTSDILKINCQVKGVSIEPQIQQAISDFNTSKDFLPNSTITPDTLKTGANGQQTPVFDQLHNVPTYYKLVRIAPYILGALAIVSALIIVFASTERRAGAKRVMIALASTGIVLLISIWISGYAVRMAQKQITKSSADNSVVQKSAVNVITLVHHDVNHYTLIFAVVFLLLAIGLLVYLILTREKQPKNPDEPSQPQEKLVQSSKKDKPTKPPTLVQISA